MRYRLVRLHFKCKENAVKKKVLCKINIDRGFNSLVLNLFHRYLFVAYESMEIRSKEIKKTKKKSNDYYLFQ